jgi:predicted DCC family thiol-disulfide oxidoreductase YuxK
MAIGLPCHRDEQPSMSAWRRRIEFESLAQFERWMFAPGDPRRLAALRIGLCLIIAWRAARPVLVELGGQPEALYRPISFMVLLREMPGRSLMVAVQVAVVLAALAGAAGAWSRITVPVAWTGAAFLFGMETSLGKIVHHELLPLLSLIPLLPADTDQAWTIRQPRSSVTSSASAGWPVRTAALLVVGAYFFAGLAKLVFTGPAWVFGDNLRHALYASSDGRGGNALALLIADRPVLAHLVAGAVLIVELTMFVVLVRPHLAPAYVVAAAGLHAGIWASMGLDYFAWVATVLVVLVDWPAFVDGLMEQRSRRSAGRSHTFIAMEWPILLYDDDCGFCRWSVGRIVRWDRGGVLRVVPIRGSEGERLLADLTEPQRLASWHLVLSNGRRFSAGQVVAPLLRLLPAGRFMAWIPSAFPRFSETVYRSVARNRDRLGRWLGEQACAVNLAAMEHEKHMGHPAGARGPAKPGAPQQGAQR